MQGFIFVALWQLCVKISIKPSIQVFFNFITIFDACIWLGHISNVCFPKSCEATLSSSLLVVRLPWWSLCIVYFILFFCYSCMYVQWRLSCTSVGNQKHTHTQKKNLCFKRQCTFSFYFSAVLVYPAGLPSRHLLYDIAVREYVVVTEWSASLWKQVPAERNAATRERDSIPARSPSSTLPEPCASAAVRRKSTIKKSDVAAGLKKERKGPRRGGRQTSRINRARWSSLVASPSRSFK